MNKAEIIYVGDLTGGGFEKKFRCVRKVYSTSGISPTLVSAAMHNDIVKVIEDEQSNMRGDDRLEESEHVLQT